MAEPLKATFFTLQHRDRAVLLPATLVMLVIVALIVAAWIGLNWATLARIVELSRQGGAQPDEAEAARVFTGVLGIFASTMLMLFPLYIALAAYEAACLRWMIRGETPGLFGLALDHDAWRVWGVYWCWLIAGMSIGFVMSILMIPFMFMMMGDIVASQDPDPQLAFELQLKLQALSLLQYIPMAFLGVRLGPAAATSIARRRFSFFEAWTVTSGRFWSLLGSWAVLWLTLIVAYLLIFAGTYGVVFGEMFAQLAGAWPDFPEEAAAEAVTRALSPRGLMLIGLAYAGFLAIWIVYSLLGFGVNARAVLVALQEEKIKQEPAEN